MRGLVWVVSAALVLTLGPTAGAADWETTRRTVIRYEVIEGLETAALSR